MKKAIFILAMLLVSFVTIGQVTEKKTLYKSKQGFEITEKFEDGKSSLKYFYFSFQNKKYQHITDLGSLFFTTKEDLENFANKLIYFSDLEKGKEVTYTDKLTGYTIHQYDSISSLFVFDKNNKYFTITKSQAKKLAEDILQNINLLD
jgi:hypothetical protein